MALADVVKLGVALSEAAKVMKNVKGVRVCQSCIDEIKSSDFWEAVE